MAIKIFGETLCTWYYVIICMACYAVGEIGHFMIGIISKPLAQDIGFGDIGCLPNSSTSAELKVCKGANYSSCVSIQSQNESVCEWNYSGSGIEYQLLAGPCFIAIFTVSGVVLGVLGDSQNRVRLLSACVFLYSLMAFLTGWATEYWQLVLLRFGFGAGEAACTPLTSSMVADKFGASSRALGMSVFNWGIYIGYGLAFTIGNYVPQSPVFGQSWRWAYYLVGIPGFIFSVVLFLTVKEPERKSINSKRNNEQEKEDPDSLLQPAVDETSDITVKKNKPLSTLWSAIKTFASSPGLLVLLLAASIRHTASFCWAYNTQLYFDYYYPETDLGLWMTLCSIIGGLVGIASGGLISDRVVSRFGAASRLWVLVVSQSIAAPLAALVLYLPPPYCFIALLCAYLFGVEDVLNSVEYQGIYRINVCLAEMWFGILFTVLVECLHSTIRSTGISLFIFVMNNIASGSQLLVPPFRMIIGFRTTLYVTYAGFYGLTEMWFGVALTVIVEHVPVCIRSTAVALCAFVISNIGGNVPVVIASLKWAVGGLRNALYIMYAGFYLLSAVGFFFAQFLLKREKKNPEESFKEQDQCIEKLDVVPEI